MGVRESSLNGTAGTYIIMIPKNTIGTDSPEPWIKSGIKRRYTPSHSLSPGFIIFTSL